MHASLCSTEGSGQAGSDRNAAPAAFALSRIAASASGEDGAPAAAAAAGGEASGDFAAAAAPAATDANMSKALLTSGTDACVGKSRWQ